MKLLFNRSNGESVELAKCTKKEEVWREIHKFLDSHKYKSYYQRVSPDPDKKTIWIDVGSWSESFTVADMTDEEFDKWRISS